MTRLRWGTESAFAPGGRAANAWRDALRTCEEGARVALGTLIPTIAAAAGRSDVEVRRLADGVVAFCAELLEHPNAADVLFGGDGSGGGDGRGGGGDAVRVQCTTGGGDLAGGGAGGWTTSQLQPLDL